MKKQSSLLVALGEREREKEKKENLPLPRKREKEQKGESERRGDAEKTPRLALCFFFSSSICRRREIFFSFNYKTKSRKKSACFERIRLNHVVVSLPPSRQTTPLILCQRDRVNGSVTRHLADSFSLRLSASLLFSQSVVRFFTRKKHAT